MDGAPEDAHVALRGAHVAAFTITLTVSSGFTALPFTLLDAAALTAVVLGV